MPLTALSHSILSHFAAFRSVCSPSCLSIFTLVVACISASSVRSSVGHVCLFDFFPHFEQGCQAARRARMHIFDMLPGNISINGKFALSCRQHLNQPKTSFRSKSVTATLWQGTLLTSPSISPSPSPLTPSVLSNGLLSLSITLTRPPGCRASAISSFGPERIKSAHHKLSRIHATQAP